MLPCLLIHRKRHLLQKMQSSKPLQWANPLGQQTTHRCLTFTTDLCTTQSLHCTISKACGRQRRRLWQRRSHLRAVTRGAAKHLQPIIACPPLKRKVWYCTCSLPQAFPDLHALIKALPPRRHDEGCTNKKQQAVTPQKSALSFIKSTLQITSNAGRRFLLTLRVKRPRRTWSR